MSDSVSHFWKNRWPWKMESNKSKPVASIVFQTNLKRHLWSYVLILFHMSILKNEVLRETPVDQVSDRVWADPNWGKLTCVRSRDLPQKLIQCIIEF